MRTISSTLQAEIEGPQRLCRAVRVKNSSGTTVLSVTNHDTSVTFDSDTFSPLPGDWTAPFRSEVGSTVDSESFSGAWDSLVEQDLLDGDYDSATIEMFVVGWALSPIEYITVFKGTLGQLTWNRDGFSVDIHGRMRDLAKTLGGTFGPGCTNELGDNNCGVDLSAYEVSFTVTSVGANTRINFTDSALSEAADWFTDGLVTWSTGGNAGLTYPVKTHSTGGVVELLLPTINVIQIGDTGILTPGCNKTVIDSDGNLTGDCEAKFSNKSKFGGWPFIRGETEVAQA